MKKSLILTLGSKVQFNPFQSVPQTRLTVYHTKGGGTLEQINQHFKDVEFDANEFKSMLVGAGHSIAEFRPATLELSGGHLKYSVYILISTPFQDFNASNLGIRIK